MLHCFVIYCTVLLCVNESSCGTRYQQDGFRPPGNWFLRGLWIEIDRVRACSCVCVAAHIYAYWKTEINHSVEQFTTKWLNDECKQKIELRSWPNSASARNSQKWMQYIALGSLKITKLVSFIVPLFVALVGRPLFHTVLFHWPKRSIGDRARGSNGLGSKPWRYRLFLNNTNANAILLNIAQLQYNTIQCNTLKYCLQCTPTQMKKNLQCCSNGEKKYRCKSSQ